MILSWLRKSISCNSVVTLLALILTPACLGEPKLADERNNVEVYRKANPAVVNVSSITLRYDFFMEVQPQQGVGSGAIVNPKGFIVTNDHVVGDADRLMVTLHDKSELPAKIVGRDPDTDIAVIKIDAKGKRLQSMQWGNAKALEVGQKVLAIGNPFGLGGSLSVGIISALERDIRSKTGRMTKNVIQTDAAINPGNSGGPLLNSSGKLIGINTQIASPSGGSVGIGFAISVKTVRKIVNSLIQYGKVLRPWLGVSGVGFGSDLLRALGIPLKNGVMLIDVYRSSPAGKAGLKSHTKEIVRGFRRIPFNGDVIYQIDNKPIESFRDISDYIFEKSAGDKITVYYVRGKKRKQTTIKLMLPPNVRGQGL